MPDEITSLYLTLTAEVNGGERSVTVHTWTWPYDPVDPFPVKKELAGFESIWKDRVAEVNGVEGSGPRYVLAEDGNGVFDREERAEVISGVPAQAAEKLRDELNTRHRGLVREAEKEAAVRAAIEATP